MKPVLLAATAIAVMAAANPAPAMADATKPVSQVIQWNRTLLVIVRTPGAQPATIHPTRSFAIMHAAIYDAVNAIDGTHKPYLVRLSASHFASQEAAAAAAAHEVLVKLYPSFQTTLDTQFQQALAQLPKGGQADGIKIGNTVADRILALRANDGSNNPPAHFVFGNAPGDYQSTPPSSFAFKPRCCCDARQGSMWVAVGHNRVSPIYNLVARGDAAARSIKRGSPPAGTL